MKTILKSDRHFQFEYILFFERRAEGPKDYSVGLEAFSLMPYLDPR